MLVGPRETPPIIPNYPPKQAPSITLVRPCCVTIGCWHTQSNTKLAREQSNLFSKGLNVIDSIQNQKGPDIAPMGVLASFSRPQSPPAKNFPEYCRSRLKKSKWRPKLTVLKWGKWSVDYYWFRSADREFDHILSIWWVVSVKMATRSKLLPK